MPSVSDKHPKACIPQSSDKVQQSAIKLKIIFVSANRILPGWLLPSRKNVRKLRFLSGFPYGSRYLETSVRTKKNKKRHFFRIRCKHPRRP